MNSIVADQQIWILEDDAGTRFVYEEILGIRYSVTFFETLGGLKAELQSPTAKKPDLLIVDLRLNDGSFLRFLASEDAALVKGLSFIVVSSTDDVDALRFCFDAGALDYLIKPFQKAELIVKVERALVGKLSASDVYRSSINGDQRFQNLTLKEHEILSLFLNSGEREVTREELLQRVWNTTKVQPNTLDVHLHNLRKKISIYAMDIKSSGPGAWVLSRNRVKR